MSSRSRALVTLLVSAFVASPAIARHPERASGKRVRAYGQRVELSPGWEAPDGTDGGLALEATYVVRHGFQDDQISLRWAGLDVEDPNSAYGIELSRLGYERRIYPRNRFYWALGGGVSRFQPDAALQAYFGGRGLSLGTKRATYATLAAGWQMARARIFDYPIPVVLRAQYTLSERFAFPEPLPGGPGEVDPSGPSVSVAFTFRF